MFLTCKYADGLACVEQPQFAVSVVTMWMLHRQSLPISASRVNDLHESSGYRLKQTRTPKVQFQAPCSTSRAAEIQDDIMVLHEELTPEQFAAAL